RVEHLDRLLETELQVAALDQLLQALFLQQAVDERHTRGQLLVQNDTPDRSVQDLVLNRLNLGSKHVLVVTRSRKVLKLARKTQPDWRQRFEFAGLQRQHHIVGVPERAAFTLGAGLRLGQVIDAEDDILRRNRDRRAVRRRQDVVAREHQDRGFDLR